MFDLKNEREKLLEEFSKGNLLLENPTQDQQVVEDPPEREQLPYLKDPKIKISLWSILKDSLGKDLSKITVPVYFNQPLNILQSAGTPSEYLETLDLAVKESNPIKRLGYLACYAAYQHTYIEKFP